MTTTEIILLVLLILLFAFAITMTVFFFLKNKKKEQTVENKVVEGNDPLTAVNTNVNNVVAKMDKLSTELAALQANVDTIKTNAASIPEIQNASKTISTANANIDNIMQQMGKVVKDFASLNTNVDTIKAASSTIPSIYDSSRRLNEIFIGTKARGIVGEQIIGTYLREVFGSNGILKEQYNVSKNGNPLLIDFLIDDGHQKIMIDSKFPSDNYIKMVRSEGNKEKFDEYKNAFQKDLNTKIKDLQKYIDHEDHRDYVVMCLPSDSMYITALEQLGEQYIYEANVKNNILIVSPAILVPMIRLISERNNLENEYKQYDKTIENLRNLWHSMESWRNSWKSVLDALASFNKKVIDFNKKETTLLTKYKRIENNKTNLVEIDQHKQDMKEINSSLEDDSLSLKKPNNEDEE